MKRLLPIIVSVLTAVSAIVGNGNNSGPSVNKNINPKDGTFVRMVTPKSNLYVAPIKHFPVTNVVNADSLSRIVRL
ncbi:MAG: hypothetical protein K6E29_08910 [Cyanobacteria bacterium RUI128]|nr:hypothetical protein [Cyanobacteria bacterium RUI128]